MNFGTRLRTILIIVASLNTALLATDVAQFNNPIVDLIYTIISMVFNFVIVFIVTYFNNDYTEIAHRHTKSMRAEKLIMKKKKAGGTHVN